MENDLNENEQYFPRVTASIIRVRVEKLFGLYTYDLPGSGGRLGNTPIIYGENGLGKTNVLKIIYHLLSPAHNKGHRTALGGIKFSSARVWLSSGIVISATREEDLANGTIRLEVRHLEDSSSELLGAWDWTPEHQPGREAAPRLLPNLPPSAIRILSQSKSVKQRNRALQLYLTDMFERESNPLESEEAYLGALREYVPEMYFLSADRVLRSDKKSIERTVSIDSELRGLRPDELVAKGRERALLEAVNIASRQLSQAAFTAAKQGTRTMHSIYSDLIARLAARANHGESGSESESIAELTAKLFNLSEVFTHFSKHGLGPQLDVKKLVKQLHQVHKNDKNIAAEVLTPYVESLTEQATSFIPVFKLVDTLTRVVNQFLFEKELVYSLGDGLRVVNRLGVALEAKDLSSGEQQLILLCCHIVIARDRGGIFIIDEPEISLNIKWQRRLIDALAELNISDNLQFILASHSMEILAKHRSSVVTLESEKND